jgi:bifunctional non-homologous end joining protein LigD
MESNVMLAYPAEPFDSDDYIFEIKFDGTRCIVHYSNGKIKLINRRGTDISRRYPEIKFLLNAREAILDGEIVIFKEGKPSFSELQEREHIEDENKIKILSEMSPATYVVFDIIQRDGVDLSSLPLIERKKILEETVVEGESIIISEYIEKYGKKFFEEIKKRGFEGIMAKKKDSMYEFKRSRSWLKIKVKKTFDCIICGFTKGKGKREGVFGALILGMYYKGKIVYVGKVGTGWDEEKIKNIYSLLSSSLGEKIFDIDEEVVWVKPMYVCEVEGMELTKDKKIRAPSFKRLRFDKDPKECKLEDYLP